ncbi:MAG: hypothetical protein M5R42_06540 [Rhodocyclaceae bacterium]|nr:hypothetical protein [Rhodocyclaceae bacterium]
MIPADPRRIEGIVMPDGDGAHARALLLAGAPCVFIGEAALRDSALVEALVAEFGSKRIGLHVPVRRMRVDWSMDAVSNADFPRRRRPRCASPAGKSCAPTARAAAPTRAGGSEKCSGWARRAPCCAPT